jgi:uncharacterized protein YjbI with pentapeptide repeats
MDDRQLREILAKHRDWVYGEKGGVRANLTRANLYGADLSGANLYGANLYGADLSKANLYGANLSGANLYGADLSGANLTRANLSGANLSGANLYGADLTKANLYGANLSGANFKKTILEGINWLAYIGIVPDHQGTARAYKVVTKEGTGPFQGGINYLGEDVFESELDTNDNIQCSQGIHLATFRWCLDNKGEERRLFMFSFNVRDSVCPIGSDGKFRVRKCRRIGECDWQGNLLK